MKQVVQSYKDGSRRLCEVPAPIAAPGHVVIANACSLISAGTEKMVIDLASKSLLGKAMARPKEVKRVLQKLRTEGFFQTLKAVQTKLDEPLSLGYSSAGTVLEVGAGVREVSVGDRVASSGVHAGIVSVSKHLCAKIPDGVPFSSAAYTVVGSIALQGVRLSKISLGERVLVIGLGLVGQLIVGLLKTAGCRVLGMDPSAVRCELAKKMGVDAFMTSADKSTVEAFTGGVGVDATIISAATPSNEPIEFSADVSRERARIVLVGVVGLNIPRKPFFQKELEFVVSKSYGPGRYDPQYEDKGNDYPIGHVRWTEQRNMSAVLHAMSTGGLKVDHLTTHTFPIEKMEEAYGTVLDPKAGSLGVLLTYPEVQDVKRDRLIRRSAAKQEGLCGVGFVGAGGFARNILLPNLQGKRVAFRGICSAKGVSASGAAEKFGFAFQAGDPADVFNDPETRAVFIATRHDSHAALVQQALAAGKHVFVEKPLAITPQDVAMVGEVVASRGEASPMVMVGFNRRFSPAIQALKKSFAAVSEPLTVSFRFNPGVIPPDHWTQDLESGGGRIIGEACHAIDTCTSLVGAPPVAVFAECVGLEGGLQVADDRAFITVKHANGSLSQVSYLAGGDAEYPRERVEIIGGGMVGVMDNFRSAELWIKGKRKILWSGTMEKGHREEISRFLSTIQSGGTWPISWEDIWGTSMATVMALESIRQGERLEVPIRPA
jgi:predicted dehydrogenase/threonine dehydrogenase-like Zn-dependent dehydrogenase